MSMIILKRFKKGRPQTFEWYIQLIIYIIHIFQTHCSPNPFYGAWISLLTLHHILCILQQLLFDYLTS